MIKQTETTTRPFSDVIRSGPLPIRFPKRGGLDQNEEWCEVQLGGRWKRIRFHDYHEVYKIPGLYETLFYRTLRCVSPNEVMNLFRTVLLERHENAEALSVLDFGAGNGMAGEVLQTLGIRSIIGLDIIPEAKKAVERDRPWVYTDYLITDMTRLEDSVRKQLLAAKINTMVTVAALGYGDIPVKAFYNAFNLIGDPGWVAFNIKEDFLRDGNPLGFAGLIARMRNSRILRVEMYKRYCHRLNITGEPLYYIALAAKKLDDIPESMLEGLV